MKINLRYLLYLAFVALIGGACNKDTESNFGDSNLVISFGGIAGAKNIDVGKVASVKSSNEKVAKDIYSYDNFNVLTSAELSSVETKSRFNKLASTGEVLGDSAPDTSVLGTVRYRILIYNEAGALYNLTGVSNVALLQDLPVGNYKYIAYSFNTNSTPTTPNGSVATGFKLSASAAQNKDLIYASGELNVGNNEVTKLDLVFKPMTAKITVKLNAVGLGAVINTATKLTLRTSGAQVLTDHPLSTAEFNLTTGEFDLANQNFTSSYYISSSKSEYNNGLRTYDFFIISGKPIEANSLSVDISPINITKSDGSAFSDSFPSSIKFNHPSIGKNSSSGSRGYQATLYIKFFPKGITVPYSTASWSPGNLYYDPTAAYGNRHKFRTSPTEVDQNSYASQTNFLKDLSAFGSSYATLTGLTFTPTDGTNRKKYFTYENDLWRYGTSLPNGYEAGEQAKFVDPCALVQPLGIWRMPTEQEMTGFDYENIKLSDGGTGTPVGRKPSYIYYYDVGDLGFYFSRTAYETLLYTANSTYEEKKHTFDLGEKSHLYYGLGYALENGKLTFHGAGYKKPGRSTFITNKPAIQNSHREYPTIKEREFWLTYLNSTGLDGWMWERSYYYYDKYFNIANEVEFTLDAFVDYFMNNSITFREVIPKFKQLYEEGYTVGNSGGMYFWLKSENPNLPKHYRFVTSGSIYSFVNDGTKKMDILTATNYKYHVSFKSGVGEEAMDKDTRMNIRCVVDK